MYPDDCRDDPRERALPGIGDPVPTNPSSRFRLRIAEAAGPSGQKAIIFSPIVPGRTCVLKYKANLNDPTWTTLTAAQTSDNGDERTVIDLGTGGGPRFYHVEITLQ